MAINDDDLFHSTSTDESCDDVNPCVIINSNLQVDPSLKIVSSNQLDQYSEKTKYRKKSNHVRSDKIDNHVNCYQFSTNHNIKRQNNTICKYGENCVHRGTCPYAHLAVKICRFGYLKCDRRDTCPHAHPISKICENRGECESITCVYAHTGHGPNDCRFGNACNHESCLYDHPTATICRYDVCKKRFLCPFAHPPIKFCKYDRTCNKRFTCQYSHLIVGICKLGQKCPKRMMCRFRHPKQRRTNDQKLCNSSLSPPDSTITKKPTR